MEHNRSIPELFSDLIQNVTTLFRTEVRLAKAEASEKLETIKGAAGLIAMAGLFLLAALIAFTDLLTVWLVLLGMPVGWSGLIVTVVLAVIGFVMLQAGRARLKARNLTPDRTVHQLNRDATVVKEQVR
jgi:TRAP-type C4-dicarboxylate transport system permease small subunit